MKYYGVISPVLGLKQEFPTILLKDVFSSACKDVVYEYGYVKKAKKRTQLFSYAFPDNVIWMEYYIKQQTSEWWYVLFTKRDIAYRDINNNRIIFITPIYDTGTISVTNGSKIVTGSGTSWLSNAKANDFIAIQDAEALPHSGLTWYEIESVDSDTQITLKTAYTGATASGQSYFIRKTFTGTDEDVWQTETFLDKFICTNGIDNIQIWEGTGQTSDLTCPYKAKYIYQYERRLILGYTKESGDDYPMRVRWSGIEDETDWGGTSSDAGAMDVYEGDGVITGFATFRGNLIIIKDNSFVQSWTVTSDLVFEKKLLFDGIGCPAPYSIMETEDAVYFYSGDMSFRVFDGFYPKVISNAVDTILKNINPDYQHLIQVTLIEELNMILWAIPYGTSQTNNKVIGLDLDYSQENWALWEMPVCAFGYYELEEDYNWNDLPYDNWSDWDWDSWMANLSQAAFPIDIASDYNGKVFQINASYTDDGDKYDSYFIIETDLANKKGINLYKRLLEMRNYIKNYGGTMTITIYKDTSESNYEEFSFTMQDGDDLTKEIAIASIYPDELAKTFKIKFSSQDRFAFLGTVIGYTEVGDR